MRCAVAPAPRPRADSEAYHAAGVRAGPARYILSLDVDLFEACVINRHWYGENSRRHGRRQELFKDLAVAQRRFGEVQAYLLKKRLLAA